MADSCCDDEAAVSVILKPSRMRALALLLGALSPFAAAVAQSSDATLSGLTATSSTSATGTFTSLDIGTFSSTTTSYTATVANARTHVKLRPTANHAAASISWRKATAGSFTTVASGSETPAISLGVHANAIMVRVTAEDLSTKDYTVTVTRQGANVHTVSLSAGPNPVVEGSLVSVVVNASGRLSLIDNVVIPLTVTRDTSEAGDHDEPTSLTIIAGLTNARAQVRAHHDADEDDETFTVAFGTLPPAVAAGTPSSVQITIRDDETLPTVSLSAAPNPVTEDALVTVTATLSEAAASRELIPLTVTNGTAEPGDVGDAGSVTVEAGATSGTLLIKTARDADEDDETFTVGLGTLPATVKPGAPSSVEVTIRDLDSVPAVSLSASPVLEGDP